MPLLAQRTTIAPVHPSPPPAPLTAEQAAVAPAAGLAALDVANLLVAYANARRAGLDGDWGDERYRVAGFVAQMVGVALFPELFTGWRDAMAPALWPPADPSAINWPSQGWMNGQAVEPLWACKRPAEHPDLYYVRPGAAPQPDDPRENAWDTNPAGFVAQLETVRHNLRWHLANQGIPVPDAPAGLTPQSAPNPVAPAVAAAKAAIADSVTATSGGGIEAVPIIGWAVAIVELVIEVLVAIFHTASGVEHDYHAVAMTPDELSSWDQAIAVPLLLLGKVVEATRPGATTGQGLRPTPPAPSRTGTIVVVGLGAAGALALLWWAWA